jgi:hypothetical protein
VRRHIYVQVVARKPFSWDPDYVDDLEIVRMTKRFPRRPVAGARVLKVELDLPTSLFQALPMLATVN